MSQLIVGINIQPNKKLGRVDVELPRHFILLEWKVVNIDFLDVGKSRDRELKSKTLSEITPQLQSYVASVEAKEQRGYSKFHAHLVLVVESRRILVRDMDEKGNWVGEPVPV